jgi:protocatechuate 3,4-dioxygenase beta subunit
MSSSTRFSAVVLLTLLFVPVCLHAQTQTKLPAKTPRGTVSGRVTIKDKPAPGITVGMRQTMGIFPLEKSFRAVTDQEGVYRITNVPAGSYDITTAAPAYVSVDANNPRGKNVIVGEDENIENINFSLVRGGVITGKITDSDGRPLVHQHVNVFRASDFQQQQQQQPARQAFPAGSVQTDDRGIYRLFGLAAGRYKVASGRSDETGSSNYYEPSRVVYKQVFHPNETDQTKATIIEVREGSEANNIDIAMGAAIQTFNVSGRVIDAESGSPLPNIRFAFQRRVAERYEFSDLSAVSNLQGNFTAEGLTPGKYGIMMFGNQNQEMRAEAMTFDVVDSDVTGVTIRMIKGGSISGVVVLEPEDKRAFAKLVEFQLRAFVTAAPSTNSSSGSSIFSPIGPDGSFRLPGLSPGQVNFWLMAPFGGTQPKGFTVLRVEHNGAVSPRGIELKESEQLTGVRIVMAYGTASIHGTVKIENGTQPEGGRMVVRLMRPGTPPAQIANSTVDARNQFLLEGIPPGVYEISIMVFSPNNRPQVAAKREISVQDGVVNEVSMTVDLTQPPKP